MIQVFGLLGEENKENCFRQLWIFWNRSNITFRKERGRNEVIQEQMEVQHNIIE